MKRPDFAQTIQILANVGVIAGIVFLGAEVRQNNDVLAAQARLQRTQMRIDGLTEYLSSPDLIRARLKDVNHSGLSADEVVILETFWQTVLVRWQYVYGEYQAGLIDLQDIPINGWKGTMSTYPSMMSLWESSKGVDYRPDFVRWMEEFVIPAP